MWIINSVSKIRPRFRFSTTISPEIGITLYRWNFGAGDVESIRRRAASTHFGVLDDDWQIDDECVYWHGESISGADPSSFSIRDPDGRYAKDRNHIYWDGEIKDCQECAMNATCNKYVEPLPCPNDPE